MTGQPLPPQDAFATPGIGDCASCQENLAAFTLRALDPFDHGQVEHHLRWCEGCRADASEYERMVDRLGVLAPEAGAPSRFTWRSIVDRLDEPATIRELTPAPMAEAAATSTITSPWMRYLPASLIAPLLLAIVVLGTWGWSLQGDLNQREEELASLSRVTANLVESQQVQLFSVEQSCPHCQGVGQIGVSESNGMGMLVGWDFDPQIQHDVWGIDHQGERSRVCQLIIEANGQVMQMFTFPDSPSKFTDLYITDQHGQLVYVSHIVSDDMSPTPLATPGLPVT